MAEKAKLKELSKKNAEQRRQDRNDDPKKVAILTNNRLTNEYQSMVFEFTKANPSIKKRKATLLKAVESSDEEVTKHGFKYFGNTVRIAKEEVLPANQNRGLFAKRRSMIHQKSRKKSTGLPLLDDDSDPSSSEKSLTWKDHWPKIARNLVNERQRVLHDQQSYLYNRSFKKELRDTEGVLYSKLKIRDIKNYYIDLQQIEK